MSPSLSRSVSKTVSVVIPALFGDTVARRCRVVAAEAFGLWLVSDELSARVLPDVKGDKSSAAPAILVPFAQIAAILPLAPAPSTGAGLKPASAASTKPPPKAAVGRAKTNPPSPNAGGSAGA